MQCVPSRAFFVPGEPIRLEVTFDAPVQGTVEATITHLADPVGVWRSAVDGTSTILEGEISRDTPRGYGVTVRLLDQDGTVRATAYTAFDVLDRWTQAPRYGFLSEFGPHRHDEAETMAWATRYHLNGLQYYDWQYRHEQLLPSTEPYADVLGRMLSLDTVTRLIQAGHSRGIAAMPYTAIYGASDAFYHEHREMALYDSFGDPLRLGDAFLVVMNPASGSPWSKCLLDEFTRVLDRTEFDGIHIDQYGAPFVGRDKQGHRIDLAEAFPAFIDQTAELVRAKRGRSGGVIFNAVGNWPTSTVSQAAEDVVYIEVWPPYRDFLDLHRLVNHAQRVGRGKPVILAAYIDPARVPNWRLADAVIFASGGYHLELGEPGAMLADPYFPKFGQIDPGSADILRRYYDFVVRYGEVLGTRATDAPDTASAITVAGQIVPIARRGPGFDSFSLINFTDLPHRDWTVPLSNDPAPVVDLGVRIEMDRPVARVWWASPDGEEPGAQTLAIHTGASHVEFQIPRLDYWDLIVVEYQP